MYRKFYYLAVNYRVFIIEDRTSNLLIIYSEREIADNKDAIK